MPPSWHGWLHHTVDVAPTEESYTPREWEKPHVPNMTGTPAAYRPSGSTLASGRRPKATGDYQPWTPGKLRPRHRCAVRDARALHADAIRSHQPVNNGNSGDIRFCASLHLARISRLNRVILRRWETIASVSGYSSRLPRFAAAPDQDTAGR